MPLPIRALKVHDGFIPAAAQPHEFEYDEAQRTDGIPWLKGEISVTPSQPLRLVVRVHNRAGIPIIEGEGQIEAGQRRFTISELHPLGIEAYAHKRETERVEIARRIWSRRAYGTLTFQAIE